jgi:hypothetical protein
MSKQQVSLPRLSPFTKWRFIEAHFLRLGHVKAINYFATALAFY